MEKYLEIIWKIFGKILENCLETYLEHMNKAVDTAIKIQLVTFILLTHAVFPFLFEHTASDKLYKITKSLQQRRE